MCFLYATFKLIIMTCRVSFNMPTKKLKCIVHKISFCKIENCDVLTEIADCKISELGYTPLAPKTSYIFGLLFFSNKRTIKECSSIWKYSQISTSMILLLIQVLLGIRLLRHKQWLGPVLHRFWWSKFMSSCLQKEHLTHWDIFPACTYSFYKWIQKCAHL